MYLLDTTRSCEPKGNISNTFIGYGESKRSMNWTVLN